MGWHREVTVENIVALRDRFHLVLAEHRIASVLAYVAIYAVAGVPQPAWLPDRDGDGRLAVRLARRRHGRRGRRDDRAPPRCS